MLQKNTLIKTNGELVELPDGELTLQQMYDYIDCGTVELVQLQEGVDLWCDEEGLLKSGFQVNHKATMLYRDAYKTDEVGVVGNAIYSRSGEYMGAMETLLKSL